VNDSLDSKTPIKSPGDFKGLRIRTVGSAQVASLFEFLGAQPVLLSFAEVLPAARAGVINAADLPLSSILAARTFETFPFVTLTDHLYVPVYLVANAGTIQKLDERSTRALFEAARDTMMTSFKQGEETDRRDRERLGDRVKFIEMNPSEKRLLVEISRKSYDSLASELKGSSDLISRALRLGPRS